MSNSNNGSRVIGMVLALGLTAMGLGFLAGMADEARHVNDPTPALGIVAGTVAFVFLLRGPVGRAIGKMLEGTPAPDESFRERIEQLEGVVSDLGMEQQRVAELEERLDFTERLLAQRDPIAALQRPETRQ